MVPFWKPGIRYRGGWKNGTYWKICTRFFTTALHRYRLLNNNFNRLLYHIRAGVSKTSVLFSVRELQWDQIVYCVNFLIWYNIVRTIWKRNRKQLVPRGAENREAGESPARSRHCMQGMQNHVRMHGHWETGKTILCDDLWVRKPACYWYGDF